MNEGYTIYKFTNKVNGKSYVGLTRRDFDVRKYEHIQEGNSGSEFMFHQALGKYGIDGFTWEILESEITDLPSANKREQYYVKLFDTYENGYNMTEGGGGRDNYIFSKIARERMRQAKLGTTLSDGHKRKISESLMDVPKTKEHVDKVRLANLGKTVTDETKSLISKNRKGLNTGNANPAAIIVNIYNHNDELMFECYGNFMTVCNENGLPTRALRKSYYNTGKPIYTGKTIKKEVLNRYRNFIGWYAIKIQHP